MIDAGLHITPALAAIWLPWGCLMMALLVWLSCIMQPRYLRSVVSNSFATFAGSTAEQVPSIGSQTVQWLFNIMMPALCVYVLLTQTTMIGIELFTSLIVLAALIDVARTVISLMIHYTFRLGKRTSLAYVRYFSLRSIFSYVLFIIALLMAYTPHEGLWMTLLLIAAGIYLLILAWQLSKLFCASIPEIVSVVTFIITVEILPAMMLYEVGRQMVLQQFA